MARARGGAGLQLTRRVLCGLLVVAMLAVTGCATTWVASEIGLGRPPFDEAEHKESVPLPGVSESLRVVVDLEGPPSAPPPADQPVPPIGQVAPQTPRTQAPTEPVFHCSVSQRGRE